MIEEEINRIVVAEKNAGDIILKAKEDSLKLSEESAEKIHEMKNLMNEDIKLMRKKMIEDANKEAEEHYNEILKQTSFEVGEISATLVEKSDEISESLTKEIIEKWL